MLKHFSETIAVIAEVRSRSIFSFILLVLDRDILAEEVARAPQLNKKYNHCFIIKHCLRYYLLLDKKTKNMIKK